MRTSPIDFDAGAIHPLDVELVQYQVDSGGRIVNVQIEGHLVPPGLASPVPALPLIYQGCQYSRSCTIFTAAREKTVARRTENSMAVHGMV